MLDRMQDKNDNGMNSDYDYLYSIHERANILMIYHCEIKKVQDIALADTGAIRIYISARYVKKTNLRFSRDDVNSLHNVRLSNE